MGDSCVIIMAKWPALGATKTRLAACIGTAAAERLSMAFLQDTLNLAASVRGAVTLIAYSPPDRRQDFAALGRGPSLLHQQPAGDLGARLAAGFASAFAHGFRRAIAIATDSPTLPVRILAEAVSAINDSRLVLGPATDGGYYLIGMSRLHAGLFEEIDWSTERVLTQTLARAAGARLRPVLLPAWYDVDDADGLTRLESDIARDGRLCPATRAALEEIAGTIPVSA